MLHRFILVVPAVAIFAFPFAVRADLVGSVTLTTGDRYSFDTGVTFPTGSASGDVRFSGTSVAPQGSVGIFNYRTTGAAGSAMYNSLTQQALAALSMRT